MAKSNGARILRLTVGLGYWTAKSSSRENHNLIGDGRRSRGHPNDVASENISHLVENQLVIHFITLVDASISY